MCIIAYTREALIISLSVQYVAYVASRLDHVCCRETNKLSSVTSHVRCFQNSVVIQYASHALDIWPNTKTILCVARIYFDHVGLQVFECFLMNLQVLSVVAVSFLCVFVTSVSRSAIPMCVFRRMPRIDQVLLRRASESFPDYGLHWHQNNGCRGCKVAAHKRRPFGKEHDLPIYRSLTCTKKCVTFYSVVSR